MKSRFPLLAAGAFLGVLLLPFGASAQIGGIVRGAVNNAVQTKVDNMVNCAINDQGCIDKAHAAGKQVTVVDKNGKPLKDQSAANNTAKGDSTAGAAGAGSNDPPGKGVWLNYDFVPGDTVIFFDDFANDKVGDLPTHEDISRGNVTIVDIKGHKYLHTTTGGDMTIVLPEALPQRFTIEVALPPKRAAMAAASAHAPGHQQGTHVQLRSAVCKDRGYRAKRIETGR